MMRELALFAGAGGGILGGQLLGWSTCCAVEVDSYCRDVLLARQRDGHLPRFPIWDDVRTFDGEPWRGSIDVVTGGFPCQDISVAGKGGGLEGQSSGLWFHMARIIRQVRPEFVFVENTPALTSRGLGVVLGNMAEMGFDIEYGIYSAAEAGAPHLRKRIWILAYSSSGRRQNDGLRPRGEESWRGNSAQALAYTDSSSRDGRAKVQRGQEVRGITARGRRRGGWWQAEPGMGRMADGVACRVDRLRAIGNGQVPAVVRLAWKDLSLREADRRCQECWKPLPGALPECATCGSRNENSY